MHKLNERGSLLIPLVVVGSLFLGSLVFGIWAFAGMQDYKNNSDTKVAEAVLIAEEETAIEKEAEFSEREKLPYQTYQGPSTYGSTVVNYPRNWSGYVEESQSGSTVISGYFHPGYVPATSSGASFALRFEIVSSSYDVVLKSFDSSVKAGKLKAAAYRAPKVDSVLGSRLEGEISPKKQGEIVLLPLRDKTIKIWTEGQDFRTDYATILESFSFVP
jgi:hypothetical protein